MSDVEQQLLHLMRRHGIGAFDYADGEQTLSLRLQSTADQLTIVSPASGRFHVTHPALDDAPPIPRHVVAGEIVGWLSVGPLLLAVRSPSDGAIGKPEVGEDSIVGYGTRLYGQ